MAKTVELLIVVTFNKNYVKVMVFEEISRVFWHFNIFKREYTALFIN